MGQQRNLINANDSAIRVMLVWASTFVVVGIAYLCEHPGKIALWGLRAHLHRREVLSWPLRHLYRLLLGVYTLVHGQAPRSTADRIAQFEWFTQLRDAALLKRVSEIVHTIEQRQQTHVEWDDVSAPLFLKIRETALGSASADWHGLGFQGNNPATDFRGAGKLGFDNLYDFCMENTARCQEILRESRSLSVEAAGQPWYPLALVSIRLSMAVGELLKRERLLVVQIVTGRDNVAGRDKLGEDETSWQEVVRQIHHDALFRFHDAWLAAVADGTVKTYFDNEIVLKEFETRLPELVYELIDAQPVRPAALG